MNATNTYLSDRQTADRYAVHRNTVYRWARERDDFPRPVKLGDNCTRWRLADLLEWETQREEVA
ncbi:helix-turn-helix transcriptional regulator [Halomonas litopenaei]|uniref:helix-turn-helix transcriptional regulator n=1 Tax=Halomonas litopenaei TaxID=2109328 RepID=UPI001A8C02D7|nr:AlpA family phage regulatory protein [Halomonas litopenaei]MBN8411308.1 AlpA family phage regulatory protein [Halomonas litopenaei]